MSLPISIEDLWAAVDFRPNERQQEAILHTAGPGLGKTPSFFLFAFFGGGLPPPLSSGKM